MATGKVLGVTAAVTALCVQAPVMAQQNGRTTESSQTVLDRELATDTLLVNGLIRRRAEIAQSTGEDRDRALAWIDRLIEIQNARLAEVRSRLGKPALPPQ